MKLNASCKAALTALGETSVYPWWWIGFHVVIPDLAADELGRFHLKVFVSRNNGHKDGPYKAGNDDDTHHAAFVFCLP